MRLVATIGRYKWSSGSITVVGALTQIAQEAIWPANQSDPGVLSGDGETGPKGERSDGVPLAMPFPMRPFPDRLSERYLTETPYV